MSIFWKDAIKFNYCKNRIILGCPKIINDMNVIKSTRYNIRNCKGFKKLVASLVPDKMSRQSYRSNSCDCIAEDVKSEL